MTKTHSIRFLWLCLLFTAVILTSLSCKKLDSKPQYTKEQLEISLQLITPYVDKGDVSFDLEYGNNVYVKQSYWNQLSLEVKEIHTLAYCVIISEMKSSYPYRQHCVVFENMRGKEIAKWSVLGFKVY